MLNFSIEYVTKPSVSKDILVSVEQYFRIKIKNSESALPVY